MAGSDPTLGGALDSARRRVRGQRGPVARPGATETADGGFDPIVLTDAWRSHVDRGEHRPFALGAVIGRASRGPTTTSGPLLGRPAVVGGVTDAHSYLTTRNATVADLVALLQTQHAANLDVVTPSSQLAAENGRLRLIGVGEPRLTPSSGAAGP